VLGKAVSEGERRFTRLVLVGEHERPVTPCGVCRQTLQEFAEGMSVLMVGTNGEHLEATIASLLPFPFERR
jgi:cytidine deaminase